MKSYNIAKLGNYFTTILASFLFSVKTTFSTFKMYQDNVLLPY